MKSKYSILKLVLLILGGLTSGFIGAMLLTQLNSSVNLTILLKQLIIFAFSNIIFVQLLLTLPFLLICVVFYAISNKTIKKFGYSEMEEYRIHKYLSMGVSLSTLSIIMNLSLFKVITYFPPHLNPLENKFSIYITTFILLLILSFVCEITGMILLCQLNPSQKGSALGLRRKALILINVIFVITFASILILSFFSNFGIFLFLLPCSLWLISSITYFYYAYRLQSGLIKY